MLVLGTGDTLGTVWVGEVRLGAWVVLPHCAGLGPVTIRSASGLRKRNGGLAERIGTFWERWVD